MVIDNSSCLALRLRRAADRAGGERRRGRRLPQEEHHRQPELLDGAAGRGAEAAARPRQRSSASWSRPISRCPAPARTPWTNCSRRPRRCSSPTRSRPRSFPKRIAFNVIPQIDVFMEDGYTKEEWKMVVETKKILDPKIKLVRDLRARAGVHRPFRGGQHRVRAADHAPTRRATSCARRRAAS